jgi:hypothetical protein
MKTLEQLKNEQTELFNLLRTDKTVKFNDETYQKIKAIEPLIKAAEREQLLKGVNAKQSRLRELARQAYECEQPTEDITTDSGHFHKTKVKKYPKIAALQYARATFKDGLTLDLNINGEKFYMFKSKYEYNKPTEYARPATFAEFLELNNIMVEDMTTEQFNEATEKLQAANDELQKQIAAYKSKLNEINNYALNNWGLTSQQAEHLYTYRANK